MRTLLLLLTLPSSLLADPMRRDLLGDPLPDGAIQRLGTARMKHPNAYRISVAPDGKTVVTLGQDRHVRVWSAPTGKLLKVMPYPPRVHSSDRPFFSEDGLRYVNIDKQVVQVWDVEKMTVTHRLPLKGVDRLTAVAFSPDANVIATAEDTPREYRVRVWDLKAGTNREVGHFEGMVTLLCFPTKDRLLGYAQSTDGGESDSSVVWNLDESEKSVTIGGRPCSDYLPSGQPLVAFRLSKVNRKHELWNLATMKLVEERVTSEKRFLISPDGSRVLEGGAFSGSLFDLPKARYLGAFLGGPGAFSPDSKGLFLIENGILLRGRSAETGESIWGGTGRVEVPAYDLRWLPDSRSLIAARQRSGERFSLHETDTSRFVAGWEAPTGALAVDAEPAPTIHTFNARLESRDRGGNERKLPAVNPDLFENVFAFGVRLADGKLLALAQNPDTHEPTFAAIDPATREGRWRLPLPVRGSRSTHPDYSGFSRDARLYRHHAEIFFPDTGESTPPCDDLIGNYGLTIADRTDLVAGQRAREISLPDGEKGDPRIEFDLRVWERFTGGATAEFKNVLSVQRAFHPSGRFLATGHPDGVRIWNLVSGKLQKFIPAHDTTYNDSILGTYVQCLAFSPDGTKLATAHRDTTVLIWDMSDLPPLPRHKLEAAEIEPLWQSLRQPDARQAGDAHWKLAGSPETVLPFLKERLRPIEKLPLKDAQLLLKQLEANGFRQREATAKKLNDLGDSFAPIAKESLDGSPGEELRKRLTAFLESRRWNVPPTGDDLRLMRSVRLLEAIGTDEALKLVEKLTDGLASARATQEAVAARERMRHWR